MTEVLIFFVAVLVPAALLANIAIWSPRRARVKVVALGATAVLLVSAYVSLSEMLSRPKPIGTEWAHKELAEAIVVGSHMDEGKAIYLWLGIDGISEPRAYALPWSEQMARQLHGAERRAQQNGARVQMRKPFENSLDERDQVFYAAPQPPPLEKQPPTENPLQYQRSQSRDAPSAN